MVIAVLYAIRYNQVENPDFFLNPGKALYALTNKSWAISSASLSFRTTLSGNRIDHIFVAFHQNLIGIDLTGQHLVQVVLVVFLLH